MPGTRQLSPLFKRVNNQLLSLLRQGRRFPYVLPTEQALAQQFDVSRSTIRNVIQSLAARGVIVIDGRQKMALRRPGKDEFFLVRDSEAPRNEVAERFVFQKLSRREFRPGDAISELQLARESGCSTVTIREALLKISRLGVIEKHPRQQWRVTHFFEDAIGELMQMRELLEGFALRTILTLPREHPVFSELEALLEEQIRFRKAGRLQMQGFSELDRKFHATLLGACGNRYIDGFFNSLSSIIHYHLSPQELGTVRIRVALDEHVKILDALSSRDERRTMEALRRHMRSAMDFLNAAARMRKAKTT